MVARFLHYVKMAFYVYVLRYLPRPGFVVDGRTLRNYWNPYNYTWANERAVEIPMVLSLMEELGAGKVLEVGNVLGHYVPRSWPVVDKYERADGVVNEDVATYDTAERFDLIVCVSTLEHVGFDSGESVVDSSKVLAAIDNLKRILSDKGLLLFTIPLGYNSSLDRLLVEGSIKLQKYWVFERDWLNRWVQRDRFDNLVSHQRFVWSNHVLIGLVGK